MKLRLWMKLFLILSLILSLLTVSIVLVIDNLIPTDILDMLRTTKFYGYPIITFQIAVIFIIALGISFLFADGLSTPYEELKAKLSWLVQGNLNHPILSQDASSKNWFEDSQIIHDDILLLKDKLLHNSKALQEFSSGPLFVGQETKEEIIETERLRIARELHDSVSQQLFAAMMLLSALNQQSSGSLSDKEKGQLEKIERVINNAQTEMRALLLHLRPIELASMSLKEGITKLLLELKTKIPQEVNWDLDDIQMDSGIEDHLFRIVQEAISNTLRHAKSSKFEVYLKKSSEGIQLIIQDNGRGFDPENIDKLGSYGLMNMKERITSLGGTLKISSIIHQGTMIKIFVPIIN